LPPCHCGTPAQLTTDLFGSAEVFWVECSDYDCWISGFTSGTFETEEAAINEWKRQHKAVEVQP
jgi:hypothetical protein